jgi:hypothetical protein
MEIQKCWNSNVCIVVRKLSNHKCLQIAVAYVRNFDAAHCRKVIVIFVGQDILISQARD